MALRAHLLCQLLIVALSVSIFSLYSIKKVCGFHNIFFSHFPKFYKNKKTFKLFKILIIHKPSLGHVRSYTIFGPDRISRFDVFWMQTEKQTDRQTPRQAKYI